MKNKALTIVKIRAILSSALLLVFAILAITGTVSFIRSKNGIGLLHPVLGFVMMVLVSLHLILNKGMFASELRVLFSKKR